MSEMELSTNMCNKNISAINNMPMAIFSVCTCFDKPIYEMREPLKYEIPIQAGAALTDKRICELNDFDGVEDTLSMYNQRYSELSVWYFIWKHIDTDYVGVCHYRRKFDINNETLDEYVKDGIDFIIPASRDDGISQWDGYKKAHYGYDFNLMMDILKKHHPEDYDKVVESLKKDTWHPNCCFICKKEAWNRICEWLFPMLEEFRLLRPQKKDLYQRRDISFLAERLLSAYCDCIDYSKYKVKEVKLYELASKEISEFGTFNRQNNTEILSTIKTAISNRKSLSWNTILNNIECDLSDKEMADSYLLAYLMNQERLTLPECFLDYLDYDNDYDKLIKFMNTLIVCVDKLINDQSIENIKIFMHFINTTKCSYVAIISIMNILQYTTENTLYLMAAVFEANKLLDYVLPFYDEAIEQFPDSAIARTLKEEFLSRNHI